MKKSLKELAKDSMTYGVASMLGKVIGFLLLPLYTTYLTPTDYGITAMLSFLPLFFVPLASMGMTNAIFRRYNLNNDPKHQQTALATGSIFVIMSSLILLLIGFLLANFLTKELIDDIKYLDLTYVALFGCFFTSIGAVFTVILRAQRKVILLSISRIIELTFTVLLTIYLVVFLDKGVYGVIWGSTCGTFLLAIMLLFLCRKELKPIVSLEELKALLIYGLPFLPHRILGNGINFLGQFLIKEYGGLSEAGIYNIALRFALPLSFIIGSIQSAWVPIKFQIHREEKEEERKNTFKQLISLYVVLISIIFVGLALFGPELLRIMTKPLYHNGTTLVALVLLVSFGQGIYFMMGTGFEFTNNTTPLPLISGLGIISLALFGFGTVDRFGIYGVVLAMFICWAVMGISLRYFATKRFYVPLNYPLIGLVLALVFGSVAISFCIQSFTFPNRFIIEVASSLCLGGVLIAVFLTNKDFKSLELNKYPVIGKLNLLALKIGTKLRS